MEEMARRDLLFDFYGGLLTEKQKQIWELHFGHDLSLSEIAEQCSVTRQAVQDTLKRAERELEACERKLHLVEEFVSRKSVLEEIFRLISAPELDRTRLAEVRELLARVMEA